MFIDNKFVESKSTKHIPVHNPVFTFLSFIFTVSFIFFICYPVSRNFISHPWLFAFLSAFYSILLSSLADICLFNKYTQATQEVVALTPECTQAEMRAAVESSQKAFQTWKETPITRRIRYMFALQSLISKNAVCAANPLHVVPSLILFFSQDEVAKIIVREQGKTFNDARGDVQRGLEVVEHCTRYQLRLLISSFFFLCFLFILWIS